MTPTEDMHGIHSEPVTPHHHFSPVNSVKPANAPAEAAPEGTAHPHDRDYTLLVGAFIIITAVFAGMLLSGVISNRYDDHAQATAPARP